MMLGIIIPRVCGASFTTTRRSLRLVSLDPILILPALIYYEHDRILSTTTGTETPRGRLSGDCDRISLPTMRIAWHGMYTTILIMRTEKSFPLPAFSRIHRGSDPTAHPPVFRGAKDSVDFLLPLLVPRLVSLHPSAYSSDGLLAFTVAISTKIPLSP